METVIKYNKEISKEVWYYLLGARRSNTLEMHDFYSNKVKDSYNKITDKTIKENTKQIVQRVTGNTNWLEA